MEGERERGGRGKVCFTFPLTTDSTALARIHYTVVDTRKRGKTSFRR